jgi:hypothetical protein
VRSLAVFCEDDDNELHRRQEAINRLYNCQYHELSHMRVISRVNEDNILMHFAPGSTEGVLTPFWRQLRDDAIAFGAQFIVIDPLSETFDGNQNDQVQVRHFVKFALGRLASEIGGTLLITAHPSVAGMASGAGTSGSVQWGTAFRSRIYLHKPELEAGDAKPASSERTLSLPKSNYSASEVNIALYWDDGILAVRGDDEHMQVACVELYLKLLDKLSDEGQPVSNNKQATNNYAPSLFARRPENKGVYQKSDFEKAQNELFAEGKIRLQEYGRKGSTHRKIIRVKSDFEPHSPVDMPKGAPHRGFAGASQASHSEKAAETLEASRLLRGETVEVIETFAEASITDSDKAHSDGASHPGFAGGFAGASRDEDAEASRLCAIAHSSAATPEASRSEAMALSISASKGGATVENNNDATLPRVSTDASPPHVSTDVDAPHLSTDVDAPHVPKYRGGFKYIYRSPEALERRLRQNENGLDEE